MKAAFDPLVPRAIDLPTTLPLHGEIDTEVADRAKIFAAPDDPADWPAWREQLHRWRDDARKRLGEVRYPSATAWASRCFSVAIVWLWDERLFDHDLQRFSPERFFDAMAEFGGFDGIVLWHAYPIIGVDDRNQFDYYREVAGLDTLVAALRHRGLRVFVDYNPWDVGTRREASDEALLVSLVGELGIDGVFLDTMREGGHTLVDAMRRLDPPPVLEGESRVPLARIGDHQMSWAQWFADSPAPGVMAAHWFERRHMQHHTRRWNRDHGDELQSAWMNGTGMIVWDAVFGSWVGWNDRDRSTLRRMTRSQLALSDVLLQGEWTPLVDTAALAVDAGVYTSRFEHGNVTLWTVVNRGEMDYRGEVLDIDRAEGTWFDLHRGETMSGPDDVVTVPGRGIGGVLQVLGPVPRLARALLETLADDAHGAESTFPARLPGRVGLRRSTPSSPPSEAITVSAGAREVTVRYRLRETGMYGGAPFVEEWKPLPPRLHADVTELHTVDIGPVAVAGVEILGDDGAPLTGLTLDEARVHAASLGARLPTEFEWQLAATDSSFRRAEPLVWNWTESEHSDGITRFAILNGGCAYRAEGSEWYFDGGAQPPEFSAKLLLAGPTVQRSTSIGFRLAWDL